MFNKLKSLFPSSEVKPKRLSLYEFFEKNNLQEAKRIEITLNDGSKIGLEGFSVRLFWRGIWLNTIELQQEECNINYDNHLSEFRTIDEDGSFRPWTIKEMIQLHVSSTGFCSFKHHMKSCSQTYKDIINLKELALKDIFEYIKENYGKVGMNVMMLLEDILPEVDVYSPELVEGTVFVKYNVQDYVKAWLNYGKKKEYIK